VRRSFLPSLRSSARWPLAVALLAATLALGDPRPAGANPNCPPGAILNIVAHQDDDLLFLSPDLIHDIQANRCVRTVFVTAGDAGRDTTYWEGRENGAKAAYAQMAGVANTWTTADAGIAGRTIPVATLTGKPTVSLAFLRLPDGYPGGTGHPDTGSQSLQKLWLDDVAMDSLGTGSSTYTRAGLINTLAALMSAYQPTEVNTQDHAGSFGDGDHSDHHATAYFAQAAEQAYPGSPAFVGYHDYKIKNYPVNLGSADITAKQNAFFTYGWYDDGACTGLPCTGHDYPAFLQRQYQVLGPNLARTATATANNQDAGTGQVAAKAVDGVVSGWPDDSTREWATVFGGANSTLTLTWSSPRQIRRVVLYDRPNPYDQVTGAEVRLSDGTVNTVGALDNGGGPIEISYLVTKTVTSIEFKVTAVSGSTANVGLAEIEVFNNTGP
jgi:LmbE family N-acetylglucosaminyl deacetylase